MKTDAFAVVRQFEAALCEYTGAPFAVTTSSCTMALLLAVAWHLRGKLGKRLDFESPNVHITQDIEIPKRTYVGVPMSIIHAGGRPTFRDEAWRGAYQLKPLPIWDSARRFRKLMYSWSNCWSEKNEYAPSVHGGMVCVSFHWSKTLGIQQGGAILHSDRDADPWLRRARFDGRTEGVPPSEDRFNMLGWHAYMSPEIAAAGLVRLGLLPDLIPDLPNDNYPDLSTMEIFR